MEKNKNYQESVDEITGYFMHLLDDEEKTEIILVDSKEPRLKEFIIPTDNDLILCQDKADNWSAGYVKEFKNDETNVKHLYHVFFARYFNENRYQENELRVLAGTSILKQNQFLHSDDLEDFHVITEENDGNVIFRIVDLLEVFAFTYLSPVSVLYDDLEELDMNDKQRPVNYNLLMNDEFDIIEALISPNMGRYIGVVKGDLNA
jgi:hypothetical protein